MKISNFKMTFEMKLGAGFLAIVFAAIFIFGIALYGLNEAVKAGRIVISDYAQNLILAGRIGTEEESHIASARGFLITGDKAYLKKMEAAQNTFLSDVDLLQKSDISSSHKKLLLELEMAEKSYERMLAQFIRAKSDGVGLKTIARNFEEELQPKRENLQKTVNNYIVYTKTQFEIERKKLSESNKFIFHLVLATSMIALVLASVMATVITKTISKLYAEIQRAAKMREEIVEVVAHDLRNPIAAVKMATELLQIKAKSGIGITPDEFRRRIENIENATARVNGLINSLLDLAKMKTGTLSIERVNVSSNEILTDTFELFENIVQERRVTLEMQQESPVNVQCDFERIVQVFSNLIGNALKFSGSGKKIIFGARSRSDAVVFFVTDEGPGIPEEEQLIVFERYWQTNSHKKAGVVLGLAICKGIVAAHGGKIWVESKLGSGTTFYFSIPKNKTTSKSLEPPKIASAQSA